jgi:hypothetical protein
MSNETPTTCSLKGRELQERLEEIEMLAAKALLHQEAEGERHRLRFRTGPETRRRLEALIAAESECCPFLGLELEAGGTELVLTVTGPAAWVPAARPSPTD